MSKGNLTGLNPFDRLIKTQLTTADFEQLAEDLGSKTIRTQLLKNPAKATNEHVLIFSKALKTTAWSLYDAYGLGSGSLSPTEVEYHKEFHQQQKKNLQW